MPVTLVETSRQFADFLSVPGRLHGRDPHYVEQLGMERKSHLGKANPYFQHASHAFFVAYDGEEPIGRISAQVDQLAQTDGEPRLGHFGLLEARDKDVLSRLFETAEDWLRLEGCARVAGPYSLSVNDECGLLVDGFDSRPAMLMNYAPEWMGGALESLGYAKAKDLYAYVLDAQSTLPPLAQKMIDRAAELPDVVERAMNPKRFAGELDAVLAIFNAAWKDNWGFVSMTDAEIAYTAKNLKPLIVPSLVRLVEVKGEPVGMIVGLPDINEALLGLGGKLLPFGWAKLLWRLKVKPVKTGRVLLMGVKPEYREGINGAAIAILLIGRIHAALKARGMRDIELSWILEDNTPVIRAIEMVGCKRYKTYRLYDKSL